MPLGGLLLGTMTDQVGATAALTGSVSAFLLILLLVGLSQPVVRRIDGRHLVAETIT